MHHSHRSLPSKGRNTNPCPWLTTRHYPSLAFRNEIGSANPLSPCLCLFLQRWRVQVHMYCTVLCCTLTSTWEEHSCVDIRYPTEQVARASHIVVIHSPALASELRFDLKSPPPLYAGKDSAQLVGYSVSRAEERRRKREQTNHSRASFGHLRA